MGSEPYMLQWYRPEDMSDGLVMGISGTLLQTIIYISFVLWFAREFRVPTGGFTIVMLIIGGFFTVITDWLEPYGMFIIFGLLLDVIYFMLKPDASNRSRYVAFGFLAAAAMWLANYGWLVYKFSMTNIYFSGYNLYGSVAQAIVLGGITAWVFSQPTPKSQFDTSEVSHA